MSVLDPIQGRESGPPASDRPSRLTSRREQAPDPFVLDVALVIVQA